METPKIVAEVLRMGGRVQDFSLWFSLNKDLLPTRYIQRRETKHTLNSK